MIVLAIALMQTETPPPVYIPTPRYEMTDAEFCASANDIAAGMMHEVPKQVDATTRLEGMVVFCTLKNVTWRKSVSATEADFKEGWAGRKRAEWERGICSNSLYDSMAHKGWSYTQSLTMADGKSLQFVAYCSRDSN